MHSASTILKTSIKILQKHWGYESFRPGQEEIIDDVINGFDVLALLPTGGGKSICFQVPGIAREGVTLVISPLIALMQDQVQNLQKIGVRAKAITSGLSYREIDILLDNVRFGGIDFLYTSPERLQSQLFIERFKLMNIGLIVVDEAHCISEWGHDFRPSFLKIKELKKYHPSVPILALTATATEKVQKDIIEQLELRKPRKHEASFDRKNLSYNVIKTSNKLERIISYCKQNQSTGIIYCQTRKSVKELAKTLLANQISCGIYHGGLTNEERTLMLEMWLKEEIKIMIATNAFGMGIDKPNVRFVLHYEIPSSLEAYFQEAGRGGRDGKESEAIAFVEENDAEDLYSFVLRKYPDKETIKLVYRALCNYLRIAIGSGKDESYPVDLKEFCQQYSLDFSETYNAIKILELNGNLTFSELFYQPTKVLFVVSNIDLYNFQIQHEKFHQLTSLLTRSYPEIFDSYQVIHEEAVCKRLNIPIPQLNQHLVDLEKYGIIEVSWKTNLPTITFVYERMPDEYFSLKADIYIERKENAIYKVKKMLDFVETSDCRAQFVINYFGQESKPCEKCDSCLKTSQNAPFDSSSVIEFIQIPKSLFEICDHFQVSETEVKLTLRKLFKEEKINYDGEKFSKN